jgi:hypothetical protein
MQVQVLEPADQRPEVGSERDRVTDEDHRTVTTPRAISSAVFWNRSRAGRSRYASRTCRRSILKRMGRSQRW